MYLSQRLIKTLLPILGIKDEQGYIHILARDDDVINVAGHRLSTSALEEVVLKVRIAKSLMKCFTNYFSYFLFIFKHSEVVQAAVVGISDDLKGQLPCAFYVSKNEPIDEAKTNQEIIAMVRKEIGAVAAFKIVFRVPELPRTRSGKTPRKSIADLASGKSIKVST